MEVFEPRPVRLLGDKLDNNGSVVAEERNHLPVSFYPFRERSNSEVKMHCIYLLSTESLVLRLMGLEVMVDAKWPRRQSYQVRVNRI